MTKNKAWPGIIKVGCTRKHSALYRMYDLNGPGVVTPWVLIAQWHVYDAHGLEALVHKACAHWHFKNELFVAPELELMLMIGQTLDEDRASLTQYLDTFILHELFKNRAFLS